MSTYYPQNSRPNPWRARVRGIYLGQFATKEEADQAERDFLARHPHKPQRSYRRG